MMPRYLLSTILLMLSLVRPAMADDDGAGYVRYAGFELGRGTLQDVQNRLGKAELIQSGEAGEYTASVCYKLADGYVTFLSGEMGGDTLDLLGVSISRKPDRPPCATWPKDIPAPVPVLANLHIGMSLAQFKRAVRVPVQWLEKDKVIAGFESKRAMTESELSRMSPDMRAAIRSGEAQNYFDVDVALTAIFVHGRLSTLTVWKTETL
jgi:hypothetical protein